MNISKQRMLELLKNERFPRSARYDPQWTLEGWMGPNVLWLTEWLCEEMDLKPGMKVLDMGCGKARSSVFLAKEFGVQVWATDLWISATENLGHIREAGMEDRVFPIHAEAHALPYAEEFFDAAVSLDSYNYYGTDEFYLDVFRKLVKPGGQLGIVVAGLVQDFDEIPEHLVNRPDGRPFWVPDCWSFKTADWWRRHWAKTEQVEVQIADTQPDGWRHWAQYEKACDEAGTLFFPSEADMLEVDAGRYLGMIRMVARRK